MNMNTRLKIGLIILIFSCSGLLVGALPHGCQSLPPNAKDIVAGSSGSTDLNAPLALTATAISPTAISLSWLLNDNYKIAWAPSGKRAPRPPIVPTNGFQIERSLDGITYTSICIVSAYMTSYSDAGLTAFTQYYYMVRAFNSSDNINISSNVASATTAPTPPPVR